MSPPSTTPPRTARPSRAVLARRRVVAVLLLVVLVTGLVLLGQVVVRAVQPLLAAEPDAQPTKSAPPSPEPAGPPEDCDAAALELAVAPAKERFTVNEAVELAVTVRHVGARPCLVDGSDAGRYLVVRSGEDVVWSSRYCASGERLLLMGRGDEDTATVRWDRRRSVEGCAPDQPEVEPGEYDVVVAVAGVEGARSAAATFTVVGPPEPTETTKPAETTDPAESAEGTPEEKPSEEEPTEGAEATPEEKASEEKPAEG
ncbi:hypothetical protein [Cellulosimicrobium marinum]|uniref:hypothetical protein n=1 Tax=Cellulosimicrobium marinum TaxID=1638992 RepID=UPI001E3EAE7C|nr:hypothetical protein [Cellulosimicrobium marinum]MCB7138216.1 hypothetical protein [Cellulosimicrobium marinum]